MYSMLMSSQITIKAYRRRSGNSSASVQSVKIELFMLEDVYHSEESVSAGPTTLERQLRSLAPSTWHRSEGKWLAITTRHMETNESNA